MFGAQAAFQQTKKCISGNQDVWYQNVDHLAREINIVGDDVYQIRELPFADYEVFPQRQKTLPGKFGVRMKHGPATPRQ